jgi:hypothetical protein
MSVKKYAIPLVIIAVLIFFFLKFKTCNTPSVVVVKEENLSLTQAIDSLQQVIIQKDLDNQFLIYKLKDSKAQVITKEKEVIIHDTISKIVNIPQRFTDTILIKSSNPQITKSSIEFSLKDAHIGLTGTIDTLGITLQRITINNTISLKDEVKRRFFTESHAITFQQSNPYVTSVIPVYLYQKPTRRGLFLQKIGYTALGFGFGYASSEFKVFKN